MVVGAPRNPNKPLPEGWTLLPVQSGFLLHVRRGAPIRAHLQCTYNNHTFR